MLCFAGAMFASIALSSTADASWIDDPFVVGQVMAAIEQVEVEVKQAEAKVDAQKAAGEAKKVSDEAKNAAKEAAKKRLEDHRKRFEEAQAKQESEHKEDLAKIDLDSITLAENPTREQVREYVVKLVRTGDQIKRIRNTDPQVKKLQKVPAEHFDVLLGEDLRLMRGHGYVRYAVTGESAKKHKAAIIAAAGRESWLVSIIVQNKWTKEAGPVFVDAVNDDPLHVSTTLIRYAITADGPAVRDALIERLVAGDNRSSTYSYLKQIPGDPLELDTAVALAWERVNNDPAMANERRRLLHYAMQHGQPGAVEESVNMYRAYAERLNNPKLSKASRDSTARLLRSRVVDHFQFDGEVDEFYSWYDRVKDRVQWDRVARKYCVPVLG